MHSDIWWNMEWTQKNPIATHKPAMISCYISRRYPRTSPNILFFWEVDRLSVAWPGLKTVTCCQFWVILCWLLLVCSWGRSIDGIEKPMKHNLPESDAEIHEFGIWAPPWLCVPYIFTYKSHSHISLTHKIDPVFMDRSPLTYSIF